MNKVGWLFAPVVLSNVVAWNAIAQSAAPVQFAVRPATPTSSEVCAENGCGCNCENVGGGYSDLQEEVGVDEQTRERLIRILEDYYNTPARTGIGTRDHERVIRAEADKMTALMTSARALLGEEGLDRFYVYLNSGRERHVLGVLDSHLSLDDKLSSHQKARLMELLTELNEQMEAFRPHGLLGPLGPEFTQDEQRLINEADNVRGNEQRIHRANELNDALERHAARFLSPTQLETLKRVNDDAARSAMQWVEKARAGLDPLKVAELSKRIPDTPRVSAPQPRSGAIKVELSVILDEGEPIVLTRSLENGTPISIERDELVIEITPTLYRSGLNVQTAFFATIAGKRRQLETPTAYSGPAPGGWWSKKGFRQMVAVNGVRKGHVVETVVKPL